jgi:hypothetical protein
MPYQITRRQGNLNATLITANFVTTQQVSADQANVNGRGVIVVLNISTINVGGMGNGSVTLTIQGKDSASGQYYTLLAGAPVSTTGTFVYTIYPDIPPVPNVAAQSPLPATWRVKVSPGNANSVSYTVGASVIQ